MRVAENSRKQGKEVEECLPPGGMGVNRHSGRSRVGVFGQVVGSQWLGLGWRARVTFSFFEMSQDSPNHLLLGDEGDDAIGASAVALEGIGLMNALDKLCPSFPERGALFWGQLRLGFGFGVLLAGERLQGEIFPFSKGARSRGVGAHVVDAVLRRCCTALAESEIRLWWWPRYVSSMKYPKRCQYKHAKQKKYHVRNWAEYNEGLRRRGDLTVWFDEEAIANWKADKTGKPGGQRVYSDMAIETGLVVRMVYKLAYRQTEGFLHSIASLLGLGI